MDKTKFYTNRKNIVLLATICCILWGSAFPAVKVGYSLFNIAGDDIATKLIFAGIRFAMAGFFVLISQAALGKDLLSFSKNDTKELSQKKVKRHQGNQLLLQSAPPSDHHYRYG